MRKCYRVFFVTPHPSDFRTPLYHTASRKKARDVTISRALLKLKKTTCSAVNQPRCSPRALRTAVMIPASRVNTVNILMRYGLSCQRVYLLFLTAVPAICSILLRKIAIRLP